MKKTLELAWHKVMSRFYTPANGNAIEFGGGRFIRESTRIFTGDGDLRLPSPPQKQSSETWPLMVTSSTAGMKLRCRNGSSLFGLGWVG
jgi:hypothetical protein